MSSIISNLFIVLSAAALLLALVAFWQSLRGLLSEDNWSVSIDAPGGFTDRGTMLLEHQKLEQTVEEIRSERDMGRLLQSDFDALSRVIHDRENEVQRVLEADERTTREEARRLIEEHLARRLDGENPGSEDRAKVPGTCDNCGTSNDSDARYCKRCGERLDYEVRT